MEGQGLREAQACRHRERIYRSSHKGKPRGTYCLACGWLVRPDAREKLRWGTARLDLQEVASIRAELGLRPLEALKGKPE